MVGHDFPGPAQRGPRTLQRAAHGRPGLGGAAQQFLVEPVVRLAQQVAGQLRQPFVAQRRRTHHVCGSHQTLHHATGVVPRRVVGDRRELAEHVARLVPQVCARLTGDPPQLQVVPDVVGQAQQRAAQLGVAHQTGDPDRALQQQRREVGDRPAQCGLRVAVGAEQVDPHAGGVHGQCRVVQLERPPGDA